MRVRVEELMLASIVRGCGTWGWAPSVLLGVLSMGLWGACGGTPLQLGGRLLLWFLCGGVPPML